MAGALGQLMNWTYRELMLLSALQKRSAVIFALMLRDMRTRFGGSHLGYLIAIMWPFSHLVVMVGGMAYSRRISPIGGDPIIFGVTGVLPYILCLYPSRMMGNAIESNRALLFFPVVRAVDIIISRGIVEFFTAFTVVLLVFLLAYLINYDLMPSDHYAIFSGVLATVYLAISFGFLNNVVSSLFKFWNMIFVVSVIIMYFTSGVILQVTIFPKEVQEIISFNPLFHSVEWLRSAYYEDNVSEMFSKAYLIGFATFVLFLGLLGERFLRGKMLST